MRDDFLQKIKDEIAKRVGYVCSNPECRASTSGPQVEEGAVNVGVAAHITAASENGPRYDKEMGPEERASANNGIWLCQTHAKLIDSDVKKYSVEILKNWKEQAEEAASNRVGKPKVEKEQSHDLELFKLAVKAYRKKGTPRYFLDSQSITNEQRADLYHRAISSEKGRPPKNNPYKQNE